MVQLSPKAVFDYFHQINQVPRPSKHEERMIDFLRAFAAEHHLPCKVDEAGNVIISRPAAPGQEQRPCVVLQAHMDMVCEANVPFDFHTQPIETYIDGEWLRARGTTLGADDGIGVAIGMAVLTDPTLELGPVECLFTRDEETGLTGAEAIQPGFMTGRYLINLDSEDEGEIFVGCAGGMTTRAVFTYATEPIPDAYVVLRLGVEQFTGGHSGDDINKRRANANKVLVRFLTQLWNQCDARLLHISGGNLHNAIPRDAQAIVAIPQNEKDAVRAAFNVFAADIEDEFHVQETTAQFHMESDTACTSREAMERGTARRLLMALQAVHNGVLEMSQDIDTLVETSSNLASIRMVDGLVTIVTSQRSSIHSALLNMSETVAAPFRLAGAEVQQGEGYPGWKPNLESTLLKTTVATYEQLFGHRPVVRAIHAGLECGLFSEKYPGLEMVSLGPTLRGVHSPAECLLIPTVDMVWRHLVEILKKIA